MATPTNPIERLDVTVAVVEQQLRERALRRHEAKVARKQGRAGYRHLIDGVDVLCVPLPTIHPEACTSDDASYPGWAERLAEQIAKSDSTRKKGTS